MLLSSIIGGVGALGSAIYGAIKSSQANKRAQALIQQQRDENRRWYNKKMNEDYTNRADVQRAITKQRELLDEQLKSAHARSVVGGASDEAAALAKDSANKSVAEATADIAAAGAQYKDQAEQQYRQQDAALNQQQAQQEQQHAAQTAAAAGQAVNAGLGLIGQGLGNTDVNIGGGDAGGAKNTDLLTGGLEAAKANPNHDLAALGQGVVPPASAIPEDLGAPDQRKKNN